MRRRLARKEHGTRLTCFPSPSVFMAIDPVSSEISNVTSEKKNHSFKHFSFPYSVCVIAHTCIWSALAEWDHYVVRDLTMTSIQFVCNNHLFSVFKGKTICFHINLALLSGVGMMSISSTQCLCQYLLCRTLHVGYKQTSVQKFSWWWRRYEDVKLDILRAVCCGSFGLRDCFLIAVKP